MRKDRGEKATVAEDDGEDRGERLKRKGGERRRRRRR